MVPGNSAVTATDSTTTQRNNDGGLNTQAGDPNPNEYWGAVSLIYQQLYDLFQPGGTAAIVLKSFVRAGKIVDLPQMTLDLLVSQGWEPMAEIQAMLTAEHTQGSMLEEVPDYRKTRQSFFRRLATKKGAPAIDAEVVLVVRKPGNGGGYGAVTSPPFAATEPYQDKKFRLNDGRKVLPQGQDGYGTSPGQLGAMPEGKP